MKSYVAGIALFGVFIIAVFSADIVIKPVGQRQRKAVGADHVLTCEITGGKNLITNFRWLDPKGIAIDANYKLINKRIHADMASSGTQLHLFVSKLAEEDAGSYSCSANYGAETKQMAVFIEPYQAITFINAPTEQYALIGTNFKIKCHVEAMPMPPPKVEWTRNNAKLRNNDRYTIENDGLVINNVDASDDGEYQCEEFVVDTGEVQNRNIRLEVLSRPKIVNTKDLQWAIEGEKVQFICNATGKPQPLIVWTKTSTGEELSTGYDGILYIEKVNRDETTDYTCKATNIAGDQFRNFHLDVKSKPDVFDVKNATATVGGFAQIQCHVYGNPKPQVLIRQQTLSRSTRSIPDARNSSGPDTIVEIVDHPTRRHSVIISMNFSRVESYDDGLYECVASNEIGMGIRNVHLIVEYPPKFDSSVNANTTTFSKDIKIHAEKLEKEAQTP